MYHVSEQLKNFLADSAKLSGNYFYLTDLNETIYFFSNCEVTKYTLNISTDLRKVLNHININDIASITNFNGKTIAIFDKKIAENWKFQIIMPLYVNSKLVGSIIMVNSHSEFNEKELEFAKTAHRFVNKIISI